MSDLERAQEWLRCARQEASFGTFCRKHQYREWFICEKEARRIAALLAEVRAEAWDEGFNAATDAVPEDVWFGPWSRTRNPYRDEESNA